VLVWRAAFLCCSLGACGLFPDLGGLTGTPDAGGGDALASDAGADAVSSDAGADANASDAATCPDGAGPTMVNVGPFCIDSTEVTVDQYKSFFASGPSLGLLPPECSFKTGFTESKDTNGSWPVDNIDWCDAYAYCKSAGKRLCGNIGGGASAFNGYTLATNEWFYACSAQGTLLYPYGNAYDGGVCNDTDFGVGSRIAVGVDGCEGGFAGIHDMAGNVWEWEDSCLGDAGSADLCRVRGGCWIDGPTQTACAFNSFNHFTTTRGGPSTYVGFRCCAP
jgi:sulfatase modifying factor 1